MEKILRQLYDGEVRPLEGSYPTDPDYLELRKQFNEKNDLLVNMLNEQGRKLLEEIIDIRIQMDGSTDADKFSDGFKLGARIMLEILEYE
ncbi:MAG: hypothetical protein FWE77_04965 [Clostridia bacterium]|nr:hypothetical protein [Clostridia bacterium]